MKNLYTLKKAIFILIIIFINVSAFSQSANEKIWVTFNDVSILPVKSKEKLTSSSAQLQSLINQFSITKVSQALSASKNPQLQKVYELECNCNSVELVQSLNKVKGLLKPELAPVYETMFDPNDYNLNFSTDWALDLIKAKQAWDITTGDTSVVIGVSDANFDLNHQEFVGKVNYADPNLTDPNVNHGTAVAIQAAGGFNNGYGKSSVGGNCHLRLYSMGYNSLLQATYDGVDIINASWAASCGYSDYGQSVCDEVYNNGVVLIAAAGNGGTCGGANNLVYPSAYNHVISVTSISSADNHQRIVGNPNATHQHNSTVDISSPGYAVQLAYANGVFATAGGTSFATPIVSGVAGLILSVNPCLTVDQVEQILKESAVNIDNINPSYIGIIGAGRVDAAAAVARAKQILTLDLVAESNFNCASQSGEASVTASNGSAPFNYVWSNGNTNSTISNLNQGTYDVTVTDSKGCKGQTSLVISGPTVNFDYQSSVKINNSNASLVDINNDGIIKIKGDLIIDHNVVYSINNKKIQFGKENSNDFSSLVINSGAILTIDNHTILKGLSVCKSKWEGIEIKDNKLLYNDLYSKNTILTSKKSGKLIMKDVSIHDANTAINVVSSINEDSLTIYGEFSIEKSVFYNDEKGLNIKSNKNANSNNLISNSIFITEDSSIVNPMYINLQNVENLIVTKNKFFGNNQTISQNKGIALNAINSSIFVAADSTTDMTNMDSKGNEFYNLTFGVIARNDDHKNRPIQITSSYFDQVNQAINLESHLSGIIFGNEFSQPSGTFELESFAMKIGENNTLLISENNVNTFHKEQDKVFGIKLNNTFANSVKIYKNTFDGSFTASNYFDGDNLNTTVDCNTYTGESNHNWYVNSGKLKNQDGIDDKGLSTIYANTFSDCSGKNSQIFVSPNAESMIYQSKAELMPTCYSVGFQPAVITKNYKENTCKSFFDKSGEIVDQSIVLDSTILLNSMVFPNPSVGYTVVNWNGINVDRIEVFNTVGELLLDKNVSGKQGTQSINNLSSGTYFIKLSFEDHILKTEKLIVNN
ncbi:MAG: S8 family peptidase [Fluviicola sp.]|jgi:subtilisin family serine protease|nr:S8 family peptidase [Fluviicola sp.]